MVREKQKITQAIQVCLKVTEENKEREISGLTEAMEKFGLKQGLILTYDQEDSVQLQDKKITIMPSWKWLLKANRHN